MTHFEVRDYDPVIGRWMVPDPMRQYASRSVGMGNNWMNKVDPDGRCDECPTDKNFTTYVRDENGTWVRDTGMMDGITFSASKMTHSEKRLYDGKGITENLSAWVSTDPMNLRNGSVQTRQPPPLLKAIVGINPLIGLTNGTKSVFTDTDFYGSSTESIDAKVWGGIDALTAFFPYSKIRQLDKVGLFINAGKYGPIPVTIGNALDFSFAHVLFVHDLTE